MRILPESDPLATALAGAIRAGDLPGLRGLLDANPGAAAFRIECKEKARAGTRTLLHVATDWPGHFPHSAATVRELIARGADPNAGFIGFHAETPLHWAASSDDVAALDALLDGGADIEAPGSVIGGGTALADAVAFGQWRAARRLVERGAGTTLWQAAGLGLMPRVEAFFRNQPPPSAQEVTQAFWSACHGGASEAAAWLLGRGADRNWIGYDGMTPADAAVRSGFTDLAAWLREQGAKRASELA